jgi:hypothetical protein
MGLWCVRGGGWGGGWGGPRVDSGLLIWKLRRQHEIWTGNQFWIEDLDRYVKPRDLCSFATLLYQLSPGARHPKFLIMLFARA